MEQRRLRLGDILDDYCPRERRVTNHAVVAMIEEAVKQTRCTTCDAEHAYKDARVPRRRKSESPAALYKEVLAGLPEADDPVLPAGPNAPAVDAPAAAAPADVSASTESAPVVLPLATNLSEDSTPPMQSDDNDQHDEIAGVTEPDEAPADGPVHRPLIRATLPRPEGQKDARPIPDFTVRHSPPRGNGNAGHNFRGGERMRMRPGGAKDGNAGNREPNGNRAQSSGPRFQGNRPSGHGRSGSGRPGAPSGFRGGGQAGKRGRGSRG